MKLKKLIISLAATFMATTISCTRTVENPLLKPFDTPHQTPPFAEIQPAHYEEAIMKGIEEAEAEIKAIAENPEAPTFENSIVALDNAGETLSRATEVFFPLTSALSTEEMMEITNRVMGPLTEYSTSIVLNEKLWERVKKVYENRESLGLDPESAKLLETTYLSFVNSGANLEGDDRETYRKLSTELSDLTTKFGQNVLKELNTYKIPMTEEEVEGLPETLLTEAKTTAEENPEAAGGKPYVFTLDAPVYTQFLKYAKRRDMREKMYRLYSGRNITGEFSNIEVMKRIAEVRRQIAQLMGSQTFAEYNLRESMAGNPENVMNLLHQLRDAYRPALDAEMAELTAFASETEGEAVELKPWDYSYYANLLKNKKYAYDEQAMRPYFELDNVIEGVFGLATRLYGITFKENKDIPVYHPDVKAFEVSDSAGNYVGVLYTDFFPRSTKRAGAWMTDFAPQYVDTAGVDHRPHVSIVMNFTKPTATEPSLLTPYEVETFLHEFGHALHGLLSQCHYRSLSGTNVYRDFVELPSQFNENYLTKKEFLDGFARHYKTGEPIPAEEVEKLIAAQQYGAAYACMRQLMFGLIDMGWHNVSEPVEGDAAERENKAAESVLIFTPVEGTMVSPQFSHIFSGGYAAGYYSYKWAEVLDADAFSAFEEAGIFDRATANRFLNNILKRGGTENPAVLYREFRGQEPTIDALLRRDGIKK